jgi:tripartite-type tricarboxylate transporter receptor subunit TctC
MHRLIRRSATPLTAAVALALLAAPASAQSAKDFYNGKQLSIVVGSSAGGGYDTYSRAIARHMPAHLPGNPTIIVRNMPGAGSLTSVLFLDATAPKDGTYMTAFNSGLFTESMAAGDQAKAKFTDYAFLGSATRDFRVCFAAAAAKIANWDEFVKRPQVVFGGTGPNSNSYNGAAMLKNLFSLPMKIIAAYPGNSDLFLAVERGELDGSCASYTSVPDDWIKNKKINFLTKLGKATPDGIPASTPYVGDLAKTQEQKDIIDVLLAPGELGRPYIMSKTTPADRLAFLREAFAATMADKGFMADAEKQGLTVDPILGDEAQQMVAKLYTFSPETVKKAEETLK